MLPDSPGEYAITVRTASGGELFSLSFAMSAAAHGDGISSFAYVVPVPEAWGGELASITLSGPDGAATLDANNNLPVSILRNPQTGQVRGILRDTSLAAPVLAPQATSASAAEFEVLYSRVIPKAAAWRR